METLLPDAQPRKAGTLWVCCMKKIKRLCGLDFIYRCNNAFEETIDGHYEVMMRPELVAALIEMNGVK